MNRPVDPRFQLLEGRSREHPLPRVLEVAGEAVRLGPPLLPVSPGHLLSGHWMGAGGFARPVSVRLVPQLQARSWTQFLRQLPGRPHGAVPEVYRLERWQGFLCALGEPLEGVSLAHRRRPLGARRATALAWQTAHALAWAHARGWAHGNLCPALLWLTSEGYVKILDWGVRAGSASEDCQAYGQLCQGLGVPSPPGPSLAEAVAWFERRHRRRSVYAPLA